MVEFKQRQIVSLSRLAKNDHVLDSNLFNTFKPIYYFSRINGLMPYSIECDLKGQIQRPRIDKLDVVWFVVSSSIYLYATIGSFKYLDIFNQALKILVLFDNFHLTLGLTFALLLIANDMCKRFTFVDLLIKFNNFDREVTQ